MKTKIAAGLLIIACLGTYKKADDFSEKLWHGQAFDPDLAAGEITILNIQY